MDLFRVRLNCIDHYQAAPTRYDPQLRNDVNPSQIAKGAKVPVVRIFGSTETGQKVCAHVHGAFPYLYVEYTGSLEPEEVGAYIYRLHLSIDHALAVSYRRNEFGERAQFVARITLVKGIPFYGFHVGFRLFLKIYMFNPIVMTRLADLLQQGVIMKQKFQPFEAHLQYLLQFMTDYNLYGCDYLDVAAVNFRSPVPEHDESTDSSHRWHGLSVPPERITDDLTLPRVSHCSIEVDICVQDIVNRKLINERSLHHDFIERNAPLPPDVKLVYSMAGLWKDETKRRKRQMPTAKQGSSPFPADALVSMSNDPRNSQPPGWIHEEEFRENIRKLVVDEEANLPDAKPDFDTFVNSAALEDGINTALQSVEDLYPSNLMPVLGLPSNGNPNFASSIEVDEKNVSKVTVHDEDFFPDDSDVEALGELGLAAEHDAKESGSDRSKPSSTDPKRADVDDTASWQSISGVCLSGLKTGKIPAMPISRELLDAAENDGLVGRTIVAQPSGSSSAMSLKRNRSATALDDGFAKRTRRELSQLPAVREAGHGSGSTEELVGHRRKPITPSSLRPPSSEERKERSGTGEATRPNGTLKFAIVKDQHMPNDRRHVSQKSSTASAQESDDPTPTKHVSFDPAKLGRYSRYTAAQTVSSSPLEPKSSTEPQLMRIRNALTKHSTSRTCVLALLPPSAAEVSALGRQSLPDVLYQDAFYSKEKDVPSRPREYAGREFRLESNTLPFLPDFDPSGASFAANRRSDKLLEKAKMTRAFDEQRWQCSWRSWEFAQPPPPYEEVAAWQAEKNHAAVNNGDQSRYPKPSPKKYLSQIDGPTPKNKHGFKYTQKTKSTSVQHEVQYMTTMSLEIHVNNRGKLVPNPEEDEVECIFWSLKSDATIVNSQDPSSSIQSGIIVLCEDGVLAQKIRKMTSVEVVEENSELNMLNRMVEVVRDHDPDVLTGYEVHGGSWGYVIERARLKYDYNLCDEFSRMKSQSHGRFGKEADRWGFNTSSTIRVTGRHMINIWRAMRGELNLLQYTMENVVWHLLHRRIPHYSWRTLTSWYASGKQHDLRRLLRYYQARTRLDIQILDSNELIARTSEQARLLGVDFFSVFSRGSQFKVESIMFRIAKPENFILVSPSRKQVGGQNALECLPLVMEPQSAFYSSPVLVLDFQSLYPSVMIAYNYCYSTFLGRITNWRGTSKMGFTEYKRQQGLLALLKDYINIAPNGMMYTKAEIRKSLLAKMLTEILETRVMVKSGMKQDKDDKTLQQLLNNRQLALKLLANVTYGYTSASFSGRMPCSEIADSIVQTGRETLERSIAYIHSVERWGAEVVYGDTDSLFLHLKGRTRDEAFNIGNEIAAAITDMNPRPIKLKFEKVYHPCVLLAKKRYVGYKYESKDQAKPEFDAKGIETVRRDGTPAEQMIEEKALRLLFETADLSQIKEYFQKQCNKIMRGAVSVQDFCFAREVRLGTYSDKGPPPAGALISTKRMLEDARAEPQYGERVPYVVITGAPGARLIDRCVAPEDLLTNPHWQLDAEYYISKNLIPPLERIFNLVGANVRQWYDEMPKVKRIHQHVAGTRKSTLEAYMKSTHCLVCTKRFSSNGGYSLCSSCRANAPASLLRLQTRLATEERKFQDVVSVCQTCSGLAPLEDVKCDSKDCPVFWSRMRQGAKVRGERMTTEPVIQGLLDGVQKLSLNW